MMDISKFTDNQIIAEIKKRDLQEQLDDISRFDNFDIISEVRERDLEDDIGCNCSIDDYGDDEIAIEARTRNLEDEILSDQYTHAKLCDLFGVNRFTPVKKILKLLKAELMASPETAKRTY